jgi:hypothetical protein
VIGPSDHWKAIILPAEDRHLAERHPSLAEKIGLLYTDVTGPGWVAEDHQMMTQDEFNDLVSGMKDPKEVEFLSQLVMPATAT